MRGQMTESQIREMMANTKVLNEEIIAIISPLLERANPTPEICQFLSQVSKPLLQIKFSLILMSNQLLFCNRL